MTSARCCGSCPPTSPPETVSGRRSSGTRTGSARTTSCWWHEGCASSPPWPNTWGSGQFVAMTELLIADDTPAQAWQMITVVHPDHRGHRLGLAVKLANLDLLADCAPGVRIVQTGNASVNEPMIAVNDLLGFEVASEGAFWQKHLTPR